MLILVLVMTCSLTAYMNLDYTSLSGSSSEEKVDVTPESKKLTRFMPLVFTTSGTMMKVILQRSE
jgi:hypothetical protein